MKTHNNEILIYCDPNSSVDKKVLAYARTLSPHVKEMDYNQTPMTASMMRTVLIEMELRPKDLLNRAHPYYQEHIKGRDFNYEGWLNILTRNPELIKAPIAIRGKKVVLCDNPTNIYQLLSVEKTTEKY